MPLVSGKIRAMFWAEYAQNTSGWHNDIKKPFHNGLKFDVRNLASPLLKFLDTRESQSEESKLAALPQPLKNTPLSLENWHKAITH
jgi:hypothetical protein